MGSRGSIKTLKCFVKSCIPAYTLIVLRKSIVFIGIVKGLIALKSAFKLKEIALEIWLLW